MLKGSAIGKYVQEITSKAFAGIPLTPNQITVFSILFAIVGAVLFLRTEYWLSLLFFFLSVFCDLADGAVARAKNMVTKKGAFLDGVTDRMVEFLIIASLMFYPWPNFILPAFFWLALILFFGSSMTSFVIAYAYMKGVTKDEDAPGILARPERVSMLLTIVALIALNIVIIAVVMMIFAALLSIGTALTRTVYYLLKKEE